MKYTALGLMSGTSLDGLDLCCAEFSFKPAGWTYRILEAETLAYDDLWQKRLAGAVHLSAPDLLALNADYGFFLGERCSDFIQKFPHLNIDVIASHGHTVFHQPERRFTLQIGDGRALKILTGLPVAYDFRSQDVLLGGNGAPLVPIGDELLFSEYDACLNLGGFSNISFKENGRRLAFDICPVNFVLNHFAQKLGHDFDRDGNLAREGEVCEETLRWLNALDFYQKLPPKSLGSEWVNEILMPRLENLSPQTAVSTLTLHAAEQIANVFERYELKKILCTGGGTYNSFLLEELQKRTTAEIIIPERRLIDFKEALIFGFMGVLRFTQKINILSSATGSTADHCSGLLV